MGFSYRDRVQSLPKNNYIFKFLYDLFVIKTNKVATQDVRVKGKKEWVGYGCGIEAL